LNKKCASLITVRGLTKRYMVTVLDHVDFDLIEGEIHALLGANGAGKSTLCRILAGLVPATSGAMTFAGKPYVPTRKSDAESAGIQIVQQELNLVPTLSVAENVMLSRLPHRAGVIRRKQLHARARTALDRFGLESVATCELAGALGVGHQQMLEIAAALDRECRVLILDEPTATLSGGEIERLFEWLELLRGRGVGIIYISHRLDEVTQLSDRVTILRDGQYVGTWPTSELTTETMVAHMTGADDEPVVGRRHVSYARKSIALRVEDLSRGQTVQNVSLQVHAGERLGIAGLVGSGRTELLRAIFGADRADRGEVFVGPSPPRRFRHPAAAVAAGLAMVTEDRKQNGLLLDQSIRVNITLCALWQQFSKAGIIRAEQECRETENLSRSLEIRCTSMEQRVATLSGGNQQKVAVAKWLLRDAGVFFFDEPTRGIDVAARRRLYQLFDGLAEAGKALVIVSSDLEELIETCDRIAVMSAGKMVATFTRPDWSREKIVQASFSGYMAVQQERDE
jgi:ribose transport system ATP-binding protein